MPLNDPRKDKIEAELNPHILIIDNTMEDIRNMVKTGTLTDTEALETFERLASIHQEVAAIAELVLSLAPKVASGQAAVNVVLPPPEDKKTLEGK
jgi:hypothetical protein